METIEITSEMRSDIREPVYADSSVDAPIVFFVDGHALNDRVCELAWYGDLDGLYLENGELMASDIWSNEHKASR